MGQTLTSRIFDHSKGTPLLPTKYGLSLHKNLRHSSQPSVSTSNKCSN